MPPTCRNRTPAAAAVASAATGCASGPAARAVEDLQRHPDRYELAKARRDLDAIPSVSAPHEPRNASASAAPALALALTIAATTAAVAVPSQGPRMLSSAERRVADLAALGHTNRSISAELCITMSTVEQHLTRIYRKLGIRQRSRLPILMQRS